MNHVCAFKNNHQRRVLFEKTSQHNGDCRLTGRFADNHDKPPAVKAIEVNNFQEEKNEYK